MLLFHPVPAIDSTRLSARRHLATLSVTGLLVALLVGCGTGNSPAVNTLAASKTYTAAAGNWKFTTGTASQQVSLAGALAVSGTAVTGTLHRLTTACSGANESFAATGSIDASGLLTITSDSSSSPTLHVSGLLAPDQRSLITPSISVTGSTCAAPSTRAAGPSPRDAVTATAQQYQPLTGSYNGTFTDTSGATLAVEASLSQPTTPDVNGVYHLTGYATFPNTPCLAAPVITDSTVTGDSLQATYTESQTGDTVSASGTFSSDARTLTITDWILSGCGNDSGTGLLTRDAN